MEHFSVQIGGKWLSYIDEKMVTVGFEYRWIFDLEGQALIAAKKAKEDGSMYVTVYKLEAVG